MQNLLQARVCLFGFLAVVATMLAGCDSGHPDHEGEEAAKPASAEVESADATPQGGPESGAGGQETPDIPEVPIPEHRTLGAVDVVHHFLTTGARGDLSKVKHLLDPLCYDSPPARMDPLRMLGVLMTVDDLKVSPMLEEGGEAQVAFEVRGSVEGAAVRTEIDLEGEPVERSPQALSVTDYSKKGSLQLLKQEGLWRVTCEPAFQKSPSSRAQPGRGGGGSGP